MHRAVIDDEAEGRLTIAAGEEGAQQGILYADDRGITGLRHTFAAVGGGGVAPYGHSIAVLRGQTHMDGVPRELEDTTDAALGQETTVIHKKPPILFRTDGGIVVCLWS